ncbi:MAG: hypothetical protein Q4B85_01450 [Lachnospiraceae bacterium]|nr:hypothetical protein [Lachnospiraceae bacterium]
MTDKKTLGELLRNHTADLELPLEIGQRLTAWIMEHSDLHTASQTQVAAGRKPAFLSEEKMSELTVSLKAVLADAVSGEELEKFSEIAIECAALLGENSSCLIHDSLSADYILMGEEPEFLFPETTYAGPFGYDAAALIASGITAWCHGNALIRDEYQRDDFCDSVLDIISNVADQLIWNYDVLYEELADVSAAREEGYKREYFENMMPQLAAAVGVELIRALSGDRISENLKDIEDVDKKLQAEKLLFLIARDCLQERYAFYFGADFAAVVERAGRAVL